MKSRWSKLGWIAVGAAMTNVMWIWLSRYMDNRRAVDRMEQEQRLARERAGKFYDSLLDNGQAVRVIQFYTNSGPVERGEHTILCYGVQNARAVRLDPPVEKLSPTLSRCVSVEPAQTTTYRLIAEGPDGKRAEAEVTVPVIPPRPSILFVALSNGEVKRGQPVTICYGVKNTVFAKIDPVFPSVPPIAKSCLRYYPARTLNYTLLARGEDGRLDRERFSIKVK